MLLRLCAAWLVLAGNVTNADDSVDNQVITFDIPSQSADSALTEFAEQADLTLVFPDEMVRDRTTNALIGEHSLEDGAAILLEGTGLIPSFSNPIVLNITIDETSRSGETGMNTAKKVGLIAIVTGALSGGVEAQGPTVSETNIQTTIVTGTVTEARTGTNLQGAKVRIEETGQWASTGDLGQFRFVNIPEGEYTLSVSFLGYAGQTATVFARGSGVKQDFVLRGGNELEEIVVFGQRSARAQSLNLERAAPNSITVLSSDVLGNFNGTTISEALRRAPGIAFELDSDTGDGSNIILRGLEPDLNQVMLNGVRIPEATGLGRAPALNNLLSEGIESVTISKTLLPSQDSTAAGGLVEIETKSPLDRDRRFGSFTSQYGVRGDDFEDDLQLGGTLSGIFGESGDFGASISVQYRDRTIERLGYSGQATAGQYLPLDAGGTPLDSDDIRADRQFPFEPGVDLVYPGTVSNTFSSTTDENLSVTGTLQKQIGTHTDLRLDLTSNRLKSDRFISTQRLETNYDYELLPIEELGGEQRYALVAQGTFSDPDGIRFRAAYSGSSQRDREQSLDAISFRGKTALEKWTLSYEAGFTEGSTTSPGTLFFSVATADSALQQSLFADAVLQNTVGGEIVSPYAPLQPGQDLGFVLPLFNDVGFDYLSDIDNHNFVRLVETTTIVGENNRASFGGAIRRDFDTGILDYIEVGFDYESSEAFSRPTDETEITYSLASGVLPSQVGIAFQPSPIAQLGLASSRFGGINESLILGVAQSTEALSSGASPLLQRSDRSPNLLLEETATVEDEFSYYLESMISLGNFEVIGGVRVNVVDLESNFFTEPTILSANSGFGADPSYSAQFRGVLTADAEVTDVLPRIAANYRWSDNLIFRAGYFQSASRPSLSDLSDNQTLTLVDFPGFDPLLIIFQGNPDLEPAVTHSYDLSGEWYTDSLGALKVAVFYKSIDNPLQATSTEGGVELLPEDLTLPAAEEFDDLSNAQLLITQPVNGDNNSEIWGVEVSFEHQATWLPGAWSGLGLFSNYTYTDSNRDLVIGVLQDEDIVIEAPFEGQSGHTGTLGITYSKYGIDGSLFYTYQDMRVSAFAPFGLNTYNSEIDTLDFRIVYNTEVLGADTRFFLNATDLLNGTRDSYADMFLGGDNGVPTYEIASDFYGGRSVAIGFGVNF